MKTKEIMKKTKEFLVNNKKMNILTLWIIINICYIFIGTFFVTIKQFELKNFASGYNILLVLNAIVGIIICIKKYYKKNIVHLFIGLIIFFGIIATIFAINPETSLNGIGGRYEGLYSILYYFSLMFLSSFLGKKHKKIIIITILVTGVVQCIYAICQIFEVPGVFRSINYSNKLIFKSYGFEVKKEIWATGFITNPNFFGTYMLLCLSFSLGLFMDLKGKMKSIITILLVGLFTYGLLISNATSSAVGLIFVLIYMIIYGMKNKYFIKLISSIVLIVTISIITANTGKTTLLKDLGKTGQQVSQMTKGDFDDKFGTNRLYIWKNALKVVPQNLLHGTGIDNFYYAFDGKPLISQDGRVFYDKVHNEYLQILITEGIFCLVAYLTMYGVIGIRGIKNSFKNKEIVFILPVIGYLIQAFFNISVIEVAPIFFITLGLCMEPNKAKEIEENR